MKCMKVLLAILFIECVLLAVMQRHACRMSVRLSNIVLKTVRLKTALTTTYNKSPIMPGTSLQRYGI